MDLRHSREVTVGTIVIAAIAIFVAGTMWLSGRSFRQGELLEIQFADVSGLKEASPVRISGVQVGKVGRIRFVDVGKVMVGISLPPKIQPKVDAKATIASVSLVGDYAIDFDPGHAPQALGKNQVIIGTEEQGLSDLATKLGGKGDTLLTNLQELTNRQTQEDLHQTLAAMQRMLNTLADRLPASTAQANRTLASLERLSNRLDQTLGSPGLDASLKRVDTLTGNFNVLTSQLAVTTARLDSTLQLMTAGTGTLGKLATDSTLYWNLVGLTASMDSLVRTLKEHPGKLNISPSIKVF